MRLCWTPGAGSMTTAVACVNTKRRCIAIEKDEGYYQIGCDRVNKYIRSDENTKI